MSSPVRKALAVAISIGILVVAAWFWTGQVNNVQETLQLMYG
jgi:hypothetical protein